MIWGQFNSNSNSGIGINYLKKMELELRNSELELRKSELKCEFFLQKELNPQINLPFLPC